MELLELLDQVEYELLQGRMDVQIKTLEDNSLNAKEGTLFFCIRGDTYDGHNFIRQVASQKVSAIIVEKNINLIEYNHVTIIKVKNTRYTMAFIAAKFYQYPSNRLKTIGVTGTKGKTSTAYMLKSILDSAGLKTGLIGTIETIIGEERIPSKNTTPDILMLQKTLKKMVDLKFEAVVMEVSSQGIMKNRIAGIMFDYGIFTNLYHDHIGPLEHKDMDDYIFWKSKLFQLCKVGVMNSDDQYFRRMISNHTCSIVTYGMQDNTNYHAKNLKYFQKDENFCISYEIDQPFEEVIQVNLPGKFTLYNSLAAITVASLMNISRKVILQALMHLNIKGRVEFLPISKDFHIIIDYAHNACSLESILKSLRVYQPKRIIVLFGCGGNRDKNRRYDMGKISGELADFTILTSDNPRNESPISIINDIETGILKTNGKYIKIVNRKEAIRFAIMHARKGDFILLIGKGHETYQEINGNRYQMDERQLVKDILEEEDVAKICGYNN